LADEILVGVNLLKVMIAPEGGMFGFLDNREKDFLLGCDRVSSPAVYLFAYIGSPLMGDKAL
jgi:hypothetical protein